MYTLLGLQYPRAAQAHYSDQGFSMAFKPTNLIQLIKDNFPKSLLWEHNKFNKLNKEMLRIISLSLKISQWGLVGV